MTDETPPETQSGETDESPNAKRMRERLEALEQERDAYKAAAKQAAFKEAGLNPETGLGKAVYQTYTGTIDPGEIRAFAQEEYGWEEPTPPPVSDAQQRIATVGEMGQPEAPQNLLDKADEAAAEGDWVKSARLKDAQLLAATRQRLGG